MISFIILPVFMGWYPSSGGTGPAKLASCRRYGNIDEQNVDALMQNREHLGRFYLVLYQQLAEPNNQERMIALRSLEMAASQYDQILEPEELVNNWLLTQYAKELGMSIDKTNIINYLTQLTGNLLTNSVYQKTLESVGMTEQRFEYLITMELLSIRMREMFEIGLNVIPPSTRWEWFQRLNRQITAEVAAVPVEQFLDKIAEPTNAQLQKFFDENKEKPFNPTQLESGFTIPDKIAFQYVKAVPDQKMLDSISDEEIKKYYEENKETLFRKPVQPIGTSPMFPTLPSQGGNLFQSGNLGGFTPSSRPFPTPQFPAVTPSATPQPTEQVPAETEKTDTDKKEEPKTESVTPKAETTPAESEPEKKEPEKTEPSQPEPSNPEPPKPESSTPEPSTSEPEKKESSSIVPVKTRFVSYQTETETEKNVNPVSNSEQPKTEEPKTESQPEQPKTEEPKVEAKPEDSKTEEPKVESQPEQPKAEEPKVETKTEQPKPEEPVDLSILYRPLDEVKEQIRLTLATEKVMKSLPLIEEKMRDYFQVYYTHLDQEKEAPPMPDLTAFVAEQGLVLKTVPLDTIFGSIKSEFARGTAEREYLFTLFNEAPIVFEPQKIDSENILLWVTEVQSESKPEKFEEIKEVVLKRWKEIEARPLARKRAEELAVEVRNSRKSLAEAFTSAGRNDVPVTETEPFTYKSYGASMYAAFLAMRGIPPRLGEVCEKGVAVGDSEIDNKWIVAPGVEFMEMASSLAVGETGVVFNQPQTVAYVIRVIGNSPSEDVLWERFQNASIMEYYLAGQPEAIVEARKAWLNKIYEEIGFKWIKKPERLRRQR
jgi:ribonuclease E